MNNPHWSGNSRPRAAAVRPTRRLFGKDIPIMLVVWGIGPVRVGGIVRAGIDFADNNIKGALRPADRRFARPNGSVA